MHVFGLVGEIHPHGKSGDQFRAMVDRGEHPHTGQPLGRRPQEFASVTQRVEAFKAEHPHATPEQVRDFRAKASADQRHSRNAWDINFAATKSWSVLHTAYLRAADLAATGGDEARAEEFREKAATLIRALEAGIDAAMDQFFGELAYVRRGVQGPPDPGTGEVTAEHVAVDNLTMAKFWHSQSRERDPHLHMHVMVLAKVRDDRDAWRKLFSPAFTKSRKMLDATFLRTAEAYVSRELGIAFVTRPDGASREIDGVSLDVIKHFSTRNRMLTDAAEELLYAWQVKHGVKAEDVPARIRWQILQRAWRKDRKSKLKNPPTVAEELERFDRELAEKTETSLDEVLGLVEWGTVEGGIAPAEEPAEFNAHEVIAQALADMKRATSSRSDLYHAISMRLPDMLGIEPARVTELLTRLTAQAWASDAVVATAGVPLVAVPPSLRDPRTGRSRYEPPTPARFTTRALLDMESSLVARQDHRGAPTVAPGTVRRLLAGTGIGRDQLAVIQGVLGDDHWDQEVNAPAGSGKSFMVGKLDHVARETLGAPVTVFTISEIAAKVVRGEGIANAHNIAGFLHHQRRVAAGEPVSVADQARYALPRGGIVVIDEASMADTPQLVELRAHIDRTDSRVVMIGDTAQLDAVDAGGGFAMLVESSERRDDRQVHRLTTIRRFHEKWEEDASNRLRNRDVTAVAEYEIRGRVLGGADPDAVMDMAVAGFVQDHLAGRHSIVITATDEEAAQASDRIRHRLVEAGHVDAFGVALHNHNRAGVGDIIQTRQNARKLGVLNRQMWRVVGAHEWGSLDVQPATGRDSETGERTWGPVQSLPAHYVAGKVELAYASNVHAVQGDTTDTAHELVSPSLGLSQLYPGSSRGQHGNWLYVITEPSAELEAARAKVTALERRYEYATIEGRETLRPILAGARVAVGQALTRAQTPAAKLASIISTDDHQPAARVEMERAQRRQSSLGHLGPQWEAAVRESRALTHREVIVRVLGDEAPLVLADRASTRLFTLLRSAELRGHDPAAALGRAMHHADGQWFSLSTTRSPASALYGRVEDQIRRGQADRPVPGTFESRVPRPSLGDVENERLAVGREIGRHMDDITAELAAAQAERPEPWSLRVLGPVPDDPIARGGWIGRVAHAAAYRERYGIADQRTALGPRPSWREPERAWHWDMAARMIGMPDNERDLAGRETGELLNGIADWDRALAAMPGNNDAELGPAHDALRRAEARVIETRTAGGDTEQLEADREVYRERVRVLEENAYVRALAYEDSRELRERAEDYRAELARREELEAVRAGEPLPPEPGEFDGEPEFEEPEFEEPERDVELDVHRAAFARLTRDVGDELTPEFGSDEWVALDDDDPRKGLAATQAAAAYWRMGDPVHRERVELRERLESAAEQVGASPDRDVDPDRLAAVHEWVTARQAAAQGDVDQREVPRYGTVEYADADEPGQAAADAQAALGWWSLGDAPTEAQVEAAEMRAASIEVANALVAAREEARQEAIADRDEARHAEAARVAAFEREWEAAHREPVAEPGDDTGDDTGDDAVAAPEPVAEPATVEWPEVAQPPSPLSVAEPENRSPEPEIVAEDTVELAAEPVSESADDADAEHEPADDEAAVAEVDQEFVHEPEPSEPADEPGDGAPIPGIEPDPELEPTVELDANSTEPTPAAAPEPEPEATDEAEERFQAGLAWSLEQARAAEVADEPEPEPAPEPEVQETDPDPEPDPEPSEPEPEPAPVPAAEDPDLSVEREKAARAYDALRDRDPEREEQGEREVLEEPAEHEPEPSEPAAPDPEPVGDDW